MEIPENLIDLERQAETERAKLVGLDGDAYTAQWRAWREAVEAFQAAVTAHAPSKEKRYELEMAVKKAVRHDG
ncbi:hypothetical protein [Streptomyces sp. NPDC004376]